MTIIPRPLTEWFRGIRQRFFMAAVRVTAEEAAADLEGERIDIRKPRLVQALEAIDFANQLPTGQDKHKERILAAFKEDISDIDSITNDVFSGRIPFEEGREALREVPPVSASSEMSLPPAESPMPALQAPQPKAEQANSGSSPAQPEKRKRGRPSKEDIERRRAQALAQNGTPQNPNGR